MIKEVENVLKLNNSKKYEYFIKKIVDYEEVWSLKHELGWATLGKDNKSFFPVWAKKEYSDLCIGDEWKEYKSEKIDIYEFVEDWIPGLKEDGISITVMWYEGKGIEVKWDALVEDIRRGLENY